MMPRQVLRQRPTITTVRPTILKLLPNNVMALKVTLKEKSKTCYRSYKVLGAPTAQAYND